MREFVITVGVSREIWEPREKNISSESPKVQKKF